MIALLFFDQTPSAETLEKLTTALKTGMGVQAQEPDQWMTTADASQQLGVGASTLRNRITKRKAADGGLPPWARATPSGYEVNLTTYPRG